METKVLLAFLLGAALAFGIHSYVKSEQLNKLTEEINRLQSKNNSLQERLRMLQLEADRIKKDVVDEQSNKTDDEIVRYWTDAYTSRK